jgi:monoamine oxidase
MSMTPIMRVLRGALRRAAQGDAPDASRRDAMRTLALAGAAATVPTFLGGCMRPQDRPVSRSPRVVIVGAGIAGLHAAWLLQRQGVRAEIFEAGMRTGGRIYSVPDLLVKGAVTELGGEFIDTNHADMLGLARHFNLPLIDLRDEPYASRRDVFFFDFKRYTDDDIVREITPLLPRFRSDIAQLPHSFEHLAESPAARFDTISMESYFTSLGITGWLRSFLEVAFVTENGLELGDQSALNFLTTISADVSDGVFHQFGESDERFKIRGGNQLITDRLTHDVQGNVRVGHILERVNMVGDRYVLTFRKDVTSVEVSADVVLLAIPFTTLRDVEFNVDLPVFKRRVIDELRYGSNSKIVVSFDRPFWHDSNDNGVIYTDLPIQLVWENTALQGVGAAGLTFFNGGARSRQVGNISKELAGAVSAEYLKYVWNAKDDHNVGRIERFHWPSYRFAKGSYSSYGPGQWTSLYGTEFTPVGRLFFAGEHCSRDFKGYMNGAASSARRAVEQILKVTSAGS